MIYDGMNTQDIMQNQAWMYENFSLTPDSNIGNQ